MAWLTYSGCQMIFMNAISMLKLTTWEFRSVKKFKAKILVDASTGKSPNADPRLRKWQKILRKIEYWRRKKKKHQ
jgi:hypothetical protein